MARMPVCWRLARERASRELGSEAVSRAWLRTDVKSEAGWVSGKEEIDREIW